MFANEQNCLTTSKIKHISKTRLILLISNIKCILRQNFTNNQQKKKLLASVKTAILSENNYLQLKNC